MPRGTSFIKHIIFLLLFVMFGVWNLSSTKNAVYLRLELSYYKISVIIFLYMKWGIFINRKCICHHRCDELNAYLLQKMAYEMMHRDLILRPASYLLGKIIHIFGKLRLYNIHTLLANCYILNVCFSLVSYFGIKIIVVFHFRNINFKEKQCRFIVLTNCNKNNI